jgi:hypothetical protein
MLIFSPLSFDILFAFFQRVKVKYQLKKVHKMVEGREGMGYERFS